MSRKWRNVLIGVLAVAAVVALAILLSQGPKDFSAKYAGTDLSTDVSGIGRQKDSLHRMDQRLPGMWKCLRPVCITYGWII